MGIHTVNSNFSNASDSSSFNPSILLVKPGFTNSAFSPVAGCTRTIGCLEMTGARRTCFPSRAAPSACGNAECTARRPCSSCWMGGERRSYAAACDTHAVSPPVGGTCSSVRMVMAGGWCSYDTSEWYPVVVSRFDLFRARVRLSGPR